MSLFRRELKRNFRAFLIWTISMAVLMVYMVALYPSIAEQAQELKELMEQYPKALLVAFNLDQLSMADPLGYYGSNAYVMFMLFACVYAIQLGASILSKEESDKTIEFLLAKPISRSRIIWEKVVAALIYITLFNIFVSGLSYLGLEVVKKAAYERAALLQLFIGGYMVQLVFVALGLAFSVFVTKAKRILPLSIGVVMATYIISVIVKTAPKAQFLKYFTPFSYAEAVDIIKHGSIQPGYLALSLIIVLAGLFSTLYFYQRKDITA